MTFPRLIAALTMTLAAAGSQAYDFKSVGAAPVILYDAPSTKGAKLFVVPRGAPLEVVVAYGEWLKVRDVNGELAWTEAKGLSAKRTLIVKTPNLKVRATPDDAANAAFTADKGVLLELVESVASGWIKVRHRDGLTGFVKSSEIWGI
ncbi:SH3-like domain-containing protein [Duganella sacchari]|uniref:SH3-like domain-containing protein n=1 Tax=Duganella sacchari TaxID=551987 RepID=A0A1M7TBN6_9BURK|nr:MULTISPECIES: SH3 domain-containing protein [Duganella]MYM29016.1 SH3 domain-containing protein [Duganella sp. CY15W]SHN68091.1 SH3-like domain-containing protein [Duganella sacchari]